MGVRSSTGFCGSIRVLFNDGGLIGWLLVLLFFCDGVESYKAVKKFDDVCC